MRRAWALSLLLSAAAVLTWLLVPAALQPPPHRVSLTAAAGQTPRAPIADSHTTASAPSALDRPRVARTSESFSQRLRCTQVRFFYRRVAPPDVLRLLCARSPLGALKIEAPLAEAGDPHAIEVVELLANGGRCDLLAASKPPASRRAQALAVAKQNGATPQTLHRLDEVLSEEEPGTTGEELEACRQASDELAKLQPGIRQRLSDALGRSVQALRGENELEVDIEYARKMRLPGDAEGEENLAQLLLQKGTPDSQAEAMKLLREAAKSSPSAKTALGRCLLKGCPTPAADPAEARQLLSDAARAGDLLALMTLAGPADSRGADLDPNLPAGECYAWSEFLRHLHEEGCFGATDYFAWAIFHGQHPNLLALSPADAAAAQARAAALLAEQLDETRALLGCE